MDRQARTMEQYRPHDEHDQPSREGVDYRAVLSSIRADQDRETFVTDLRQNKDQLLSMTRELMDNPADTPEQRRKLAVGVILDVVLKQHVFNIDPFATNRLDDDEVQEDREAAAFEFISKSASTWLYDHPDSEAAKAVSVLGIYAPPEQHHNLLKEMWPSLLPFIACQSEGEK